jgi:hypothetical protein
MSIKFTAGHAVPVLAVPRDSRDPYRTQSHLPIELGERA